MPMTPNALLDVSGGNVLVSSTTKVNHEARGRSPGATTVLTLAPRAG